MAAAADRHGVQPDRLSPGGPRLCVGQPPPRRHAAGGEREAGAALQHIYDCNLMLTAVSTVSRSAGNLLKALSQPAQPAAWHHVCLAMPAENPLGQCSSGG
jgi:hypothetical protein